MAKKKLLKPKPPISTAKSSKDVIIFAEKGLAAVKTTTKKHHAEFMSSSINKVAGMEKAKKVKPETRTKAEIKQDIEDDKLDLEVVKLLNSKSMIDEFVAKQLTGKERRKHREKILDTKLKIKQK